jgi:hypothetical protein
MASLEFRLVASARDRLRDDPEVMAVTRELREVAMMRRRWARHESRRESAGRRSFGSAANPT